MRSGFVPSLGARPGGGLRRHALAIGVLIAVSLGLALTPLLSGGAVLGLALVIATALWPMVVLGVMLALGPVDLSFITGGARGLLEGLGGLDMSGIRLLAVSAGFCVVLLVRGDGPRALTSTWARWYVAFLVFACATLVGSPAALEGVRLLVKLAYPLLVFLVVMAPTRSGEQVERLVDWTLVGAAVLLVVNPVFVLSGGYAVEEGVGVRVWGPGSHHNPFSFYLLVVLLISLARFRTRGQARYLVLSAMAVLWIALTLTRITMLAGLVAIVVVALYTGVVDRRWRLATGILVSGAIAGAVLVQTVLVRTFGYVPGPGELMALAGDPVSLYQAINWQGREALWAILWLEFLSSPWTGSGLGASSAALASAWFAGGIAHNEYLRLLVDTGLIGCTLFFLAVLAWLRAALSLRRHGPAVEEMVLPAVAAIVAWSVISITDNAFDYYGPFTQYVAVLVAGALVMRADVGGETPVENPSLLVPEPSTVG